MMGVASQMLFSVERATGMEEFAKNEVNKKKLASCNQFGHWSSDPSGPIKYNGKSGDPNCAAQDR